MPNDVDVDDLRTISCVETVVRVGRCKRCASRGQVLQVATHLCVEMVGCADPHDVVTLAGDVIEHLSADAID